MKNWGLDQTGFTVVPTLIFDTTKAKALYADYHNPTNWWFFRTSMNKSRHVQIIYLAYQYINCREKTR